MPRRAVVFDDSFFDSLNRLAPAERDGRGRPSRSDLLAYVIMPLRDLLADDYERHTIQVPEDDLFRVLIQASPWVRRVRLYTYELDDTVHVFDIDLEFFLAEPDPEDLDDQ